MSQTPSRQSFRSKSPQGFAGQRTRNSSNRDSTPKYGAFGGGSKSRGPSTNSSFQRSQDGFGKDSSRFKNSENFAKNKFEGRPEFKKSEFGKPDVGFEKRVFEDRSNFRKTDRPKRDFEGKSRFDSEKPRRSFENYSRQENEFVGRSNRSAVRFGQSSQENLRQEFTSSKFSKPTRSDFAETDFRKEGFGAQRRSAGSSGSTLNSSKLRFKSDLKVKNRDEYQSYIDGAKNEKSARFPRFKNKDEGEFRSSFRGKSQSRHSEFSEKVDPNRPRSTKRSPKTENSSFSPKKKLNSASKADSESQDFSSKPFENKPEGQYATVKHSHTQSDLFTEFLNQNQVKAVKDELSSKPQPSQEEALQDWKTSEEPRARLITSPLKEEISASLHGSFDTSNFGKIFVREQQSEENFASLSVQNSPLIKAESAETGSKLQDFEDFLDENFEENQDLASDSSGFDSSATEDLEEIFSSRPEIKPVRIAKVIADAGYCSRREAEELILEGRVKVNGKFIDTPATLITDHSIKIDGKLLSSRQEKRLFLFNKPTGYLCTNSDPEERPTVFDLLPKNLPRLIAVGRLDFNTEGLLLFATNGEMARYMELPKNKWIRKYRVRVFGKLNHERLAALSKGIKIGNVRYGPIEVKIEMEKESNSWLMVSLSEGKNREIRKIMEELGLQVNRLIRIAFGPFSLQRLSLGQIVEVNKKILKNSLPSEF